MTSVFMSDCTKFSVVITLMITQSSLCNQFIDAAIISTAIKIVPSLAELRGINVKLCQLNEEIEELNSYQECSNKTLGDVLRDRKEFLKWVLLSQKEVLSDFDYQFKLAEKKPDSIFLSQGDVIITTLDVDKIEQLKKIGTERIGICETGEVHSGDPEYKDIYTLETIESIFGEFLKQNAKEYLTIKVNEFEQKKIKIEISIDSTRKEIENYVDKFANDRNEVKKTIYAIAEKSVKSYRYSYKEIYYGTQISVTNRSYGCQINQRNKLTNTFIEQASRLQLPVLDIGCGFGINVLPILEQGNTQVWVMDLDATNLATLIMHTPKNGLHRLKVFHGRFPIHNQKILKDVSIGAILLSHVAHYYAPEEEDSAFKEIYRILSPGGKLFFQSLTYNAAPYTALSDRYYNAKRGYKEYLKKFPKDHFFESRSASLAERYPTFLDDNGLAPHPQHKLVVSRELAYMGFFIEQAAHFHFEDETQWKTKQESPCINNYKPQIVGIIALKLKA